MKMAILAVQQWEVAQKRMGYTVTSWKCIQRKPGCCAGGTHRCLKVFLEKADTECCGIARRHLYHVLLQATKDLAGLVELWREAVEEDLRRMPTVAAMENLRKAFPSLPSRTEEAHCYVRSWLCKVEAAVAVIGKGDPAEVRYQEPITVLRDTVSGGDVLARTDEVAELFGMVKKHRALLDIPAGRKSHRMQDEPLWAEALEHYDPTTPGETGSCDLSPTPAGFLSCLRGFPGVYVEGREYPMDLHASGYMMDSVAAVHARIPASQILGGLSVDGVVEDQEYALGNGMRGNGRFGDKEKKRRLAVLETTRAQCGGVRTMVCCAHQCWYAVATDRPRVCAALSIFSSGIVNTTVFHADEANKDRARLMRELLTLEFLLFRESSRTVASVPVNPRILPQDHHDDLIPQAGTEGFEDNVKNSEDDRIRMTGAEPLLLRGTMLRNIPMKRDKQHGPLTRHGLGAAAAQLRTVTSEGDGSFGQGAAFNDEDLGDGLYSQSTPCSVCHSRKSCPHIWGTRGRGDTGSEHFWPSQWRSRS